MRRPRSIDTARLARLVAAAPLALALASAAAGQQFVERGVKGYLPVALDESLAAALADVDGDGDLDLVKGGYSGHVLYLNDGQGRFADAPGRIPASFGPRSLAPGDLDGDGDLDLVSGGSGHLAVLENDGGGTFSDESSTALPPLAFAPEVGGLALADFDLDGDLDLFVGTSTELQDELYLENDGSGTFAAIPIPQLAGRTEGVAAGDIDGDGDPDVVLARHGTRNRTYVNDAGVLSLGDRTRLPSSTADHRDVELADLDLDGDLDVVFGVRVQPSLVHLNDGTGYFTDLPGAIPTATDEPRGIAVEDLDADGDPDLLMGVSSDPPGLPTNLLYLNDGSGAFTQGTLPVDEDATYGVAVGDVDGDGDPDAVFANRDQQDRLYLNDGSAGFVNAARARIPFEARPASAGVAADVDGDGDLDLLLGRGAPGRMCFGSFSFFCVEPVEQLANEGPGIFAQVTTGRMPDQINNATALAAGDVDGDGDPDLLVGNAHVIHLGSPLRLPTGLLLNDGTGRYADASQRLPVDPLGGDATAALLADVDGDGDQDVLLAPAGDQKRLYLNEGAGVFHDATAARLPAEADPTTALTLADVDLDGDLDLALGNLAAPGRLYLNDGNGAFQDVSATHLPAVAAATRAIGTGDFDLDGDPDLVLGNDGGPGLFLNQGTGVFLDESSRMPPHPGSTSALGVSDVDGDGDPDVVLCTGPSGLVRLYLGDGTAHFAEAPERMPVLADTHHGLVVADLEGDGDSDLYVGAEAGDRLLLNRHRQLSAPRFALIGEGYELAFDVEPGYGSAPHAAVAALSSQLAVPSFSLPPLVGRVHLLPPLTVLPATLVPSPGGSASLVQPIPLDPSLLGTRFHAQAVILGAGHHLRLTGYVSDQIRL